MLTFVYDLCRVQDKLLVFLIRIVQDRCYALRCAHDVIASGLADKLRKG